MIFVNDQLDIPLPKAPTREIAGVVMPVLKPHLTQDEWEDMQADVEFFGDWYLNELSVEQFQLVIKILEQDKTTERFISDLRAPLLDKLKSDPRYSA